MGIQRNDGDVEEVIDAAQPLVDSHHHFWDGSLKTPSCEIAVGKYDLAALLSDFGTGHSIAASVFVESFSHYRSYGAQEFRSVGETANAEAVAIQSSSIPSAIVAFADLRRGDRVEEVLEAHLQASSRVRGIRHSVAWHEDIRLRIPLLADTVYPCMLGNSEFRRGIARLERHGLIFETFLFHPQLPELTALARAIPNVQIVLDHLGTPLGIGPFAGRVHDVFNDWSRAIGELATCPNVMLKIGGLTMASSPLAAEHPRWNSSWQLADAMWPWVSAAVDAFSPARCMFEGNFPVEKRTCNYMMLWNAFKRIASRYSPGERGAMLATNSANIYRFDLPG